jgi:thioredoxin reductase
LLPLLKDTNLFSNVSPSKDNWLVAGGGNAGLGYTLIITKSHSRIELTISSSSKEKNKAWFKKLLRNKLEIDQAFGQPLTWEELPENKMSRVKYELQDVNLYNESDWDKMNEFFVFYLPKFEKALQGQIKKIRGDVSGTRDCPAP